MPHLRDDGDEAVSACHDASDDGARDRVSPDRDDERGRDTSRACDDACHAPGRAFDTAHERR